MIPRKIHGYPVLIVGAGRGGTALLEMFMEDALVNILGVVDPETASPGVQLAQSLGIPIFSHISKALQLCNDYPDCIIYNLTHDDAVAAEVAALCPNKKVTSGPEAKLFWQIVTNLKRIKEELETSQGQLNAIINHAIDGIITINETGEIQGFNPAAEEVFGYSRAEVVGKSIKMLLTETSLQDYAADIEHYLKAGKAAAGIRGCEVTAIRKNGKQFPMEISASEMALKDQRFFVGIVRDVTDRKLIEQQIRHMAHHDYLTGLPNRALFLDQLERAIHLARRNDYRLGVLFLDLDGFKQINDVLGHEAGDMLLKEVSRRLKEIIRSSDTVARMGGDEFTFVLNDIGMDENAANVAQKVIDALSVPVQLADRQCKIGGSIGISFFPDHAEDADTLLRLADEAMYIAKQSGKNTFRLH
jgi:diguanylate cyclase (GGDEF)-like protein/PAS domain S-box-containing protein